MKTLEIMPWMTEETNETTEADKLHVPEYIQFIALAVLKQYDFSVRCMDVAATKPKKGGAIWKIETSEGPKSLKLLHRRPPRSIFSLGAQEYLCDNGPGFGDRQNEHGGKMCSRRRKNLVRSRVDRSLTSAPERFRRREKTLLRTPGNSIV